MRRRIFWRGELDDGRGDLARFRFVDFERVFRGDGDARFATGRDAELDDADDDDDDDDDEADGCGNSIFFVFDAACTDRTRLITP